MGLAFTRVMSEDRLLLTTGSMLRKLQWTGSYQNPKEEVRDRSRKKGPRMKEETPFLEVQEKIRYWEHIHPLLPHIPPPYPQNTTLQSETSSRNTQD